MDELSGITVIIPSYDPDEKLSATVESVVSAGFGDVVLVDDGSAPDRAAIFESVSAMPGVTLLRHETNRGKGAALKTAYEYVLNNRKGLVGTVTADGDGQHLAKDISACALEMAKTGKVVLGCRDFSLPGIPERSLKGNNITKNVFRRFFKIEVSDTQTGLRAVPAEYIPALLETAGNRYEYENNMLLTLRDRGIPFCEVKIETVYIDENAASHFRPVRDSARIYYHLFESVIKYALSSLFCTLVENVFQTVLHDALAKTIANGFLLELVDFLPARVISAALNYVINRKFVFKQKKSAASLGRYAVLWICQAAFTLLCVAGAEAVTGGTSGFAYFLLITVIKTAIFFISYKIQNRWVFKN